MYVLNSLLKYHDKKELLSIDHIPSEVLDLFIILLGQNQINCLLKVSKFCQLLWSDMRKHFNCESRTVLHFIIFQVSLKEHFIKDYDEKIITVFRNNRADLLNYSFS